jgi:uncharacterized protein YxjI
MKRLILMAGFAALLGGPGLGHADDELDPEARRPAWRQPAPLRAGSEQEALEPAEDDPHAGDPMPDRIRLYDELGQRAGRVERHPTFSNTLNVYDDYGKRTRQIRPHPVFEDRLDVYDESGRRIQNIRKHPVFDDQYDIYDERGRRVGSVRENPVIEGRYDIYDERGRRTGRAEAE